MPVCSEYAFTYFRLILFIHTHLGFERRRRLSVKTYHITHFLCHVLPHKVFELVCQLHYMKYIYPIKTIESILYFICVAFFNVFCNISHNFVANLQVHVNSCYQSETHSQQATMVPIIIIIILYHYNYVINIANTSHRVL